ncbi:MAG: enoyl-CoA hydratase/isomerase family protein, partial [Bacteroidales bacterium]|nr:enoyl-CoA hydratase/isomerase family protein [Bacteroidales bacterium]
MDNYQTIQFITDHDTGILYLNRPEIHNAFNEVMIAEIIDCFTEIEKNRQIRYVVLKGRGKSFCAGANLNWMRDVADYSYEQNLRESNQLSACFETIYNCSKPTIAVVHGAVIGGANGLMAACDFAYCAEDTVFSLSEVKIGIIPACISPFVLKRTGEFWAKELMLTGKRFDGHEARAIGLVNKSVPFKELDRELESLLSVLKTSGPEAIKQCKVLISEVVNHLT